MSCLQHLTNGRMRKTQPASLPVRYFKVINFQNESQIGIKSIIKSLSTSIHWNSPGFPARLADPRRSSTAPQCESQWVKEPSRIIQNIYIYTYKVYIYIHIYMYIYVYIFVYICAYLRFMRVWSFPILSTWDLITYPQLNSCWTRIPFAPPRLWTASMCLQKTLHVRIYIYIYMNIYNIYILIIFACTNISLTLPTNYI